MGKIHVIICCLLTFVVQIESFSLPLANRIIKIESGEISGIRNAVSDVIAFKGIPYAAPPVNNLRWQAPQSVKSWTGILKCESFGSSPVQNKPAPFSMWTQEFLVPAEPISEDCLHLNIWTAAKTPGEKRAVIIWIHGGGFTNGGTAVPIYDGEAMAKKGIVFVSLNYRVGIFGFFAHPELTKESGHHASGNYGLLDQIAALQWIQRNISAFGGDPGNITIAGQSAGAESISCLIASPLAQKLFHKAIMQSGSDFGKKLSVLSDAEKTNAKLFSQNSIADLRKISAEELLARSQVNWAPVIDGYVLPSSIAKTFEVGQQNTIALLCGWNDDEGFGPFSNAETYLKDINTDFGTEADQYLRFYPGTNDSIATLSQLRMSRDWIFGAKVYGLANALNKQSSESIYMYRFARKLPFNTGAENFGAFHTGEVAYAFNNLKFLHRPWQTADQQLAQTMSDYWVNFVKNGNPNGGKLPDWPAYTTDKKEVMFLNEKSFAKPLPDSDALDFILSKILAR